MKVLDQTIIAEINKVLTEAQLSREMSDLIHSALNVDSMNGEMFKWAHLTLMSCECVSGKSETALPGAIAMELAALAADIFDDVQDQDNDEMPWRQIPDSNAISLAICLSMLSGKAIAALPDDKDQRFYKEVSQALSHMWVTASDGQFQEVLFDTCEQMALDQYFELVKRKSGSLTAAACKIGAILGGANDLRILQLERYGTEVGIMSQIRNDLNDFLDLEKKKDLLSNRKTLPKVYLLNILKGEKAKQFKELTQMGGQKELCLEDQEYIKQLAVEEGAVHYCRVMYETFRERAIDIMKAIPVPEERKEKMIKLVQKNV